MRNFSTISKIRKRKRQIRESRNKQKIQTIIYGNFKQSRLETSVSLTDPLTLQSLNDQGTLEIFQ